MSTLQNEVSNLTAIDFFLNGPGLYAVLELSSNNMQNPKRVAFCRRMPKDQIVRCLRQASAGYDNARWLAVGIETEQELKKWTT